MKEFLVEKKNVNNGVQKLYKFPNGFGASVVKHDFSYGGKDGKWELAVLDQQGELSYDTNITDDVLGHLNDPQVDQILRQIKDLDGYDVYCEHCGDTIADCTGYKCWIR